MSLEISASESGDKYMNKFMFAGKMSLTDCCVENCAVRFVIVLMKNVPKSSAVMPVSHCKRERRVSGAEAVRMQSRSSARP